MMKWMKAFDRFVHQINKIAVIIASFLIFFLMLLTFADVAGRAVLHPILGTYEITYLLLAVIVYLGVGYTQLEKGHITIDFFTKRLPFRLQVILEIITNLLSFAIVTLMSWRVYVYSSMIRKNVSGELGLPVYVFVIICACGILLLSVAFLLDTIKSVYKAVGKDE